MTQAVYSHPVAVYSHPVNVAHADQLAAGLEPRAHVRLSYFVDERTIFVVNEEALWRGSNLYLASEAMYRVEGVSSD